MGYVPPNPPAKLTGDEFSTLYTLASIFDVGAQLLHSTTPRKTGFQRYLDDLYGHRTPDTGFMVLNYAFLAGIIALVLAVAWALGVLS